MGSAWLIVGFLAQALFTARFLVQWIVSERRHESTIPPAFWYLSLSGGLMLFAYAVWRRDPVFIMGQGAGLLVYVRNIMLVHQNRDGQARQPRPGFLVPWLLLAVFAVVMAFAFQGSRGLTEPDEGRYSEVAREMVVTGDYVSPQLDFKPHFTKPPLTYWSIAASLRLFGSSEWSVRLFLSLAYAFTVLLVARTGTDLWGPRTGILAGVIYATSLTPYAGASIVTPDTLLVLWEALAVWAFFRGTGARQPWGRWGWPALTGAAFGLAFLTKGPPGLLFLPAMLLARWLYRRRLPGAAPVLNVTGVVALLVIGLGWYLVVLQRNADVLEYWWREEVVGRVAGQHHRNAEWYGALAIYLPALTVGALPWAALWPLLLRRARARRGEAGLRGMLRERETAGALLLLATVPLVILSVSRSRLPLYVLPLFVPLALATARSLVAWRSARSAGETMVMPRTWRVPLAAWSLLLVAARLVYAWFPGEADARRMYADLPEARGAEIVVVDRRDHYGLEFYARGDLIQVASVWDEAVGTAIAASTDPGGRPHIFLIRPEARRDLEARLDAAGTAITDTRELPRHVAVLADGRARSVSAGQVREPAANPSPESDTTVRPAPGSPGG